MIDPPPAPPPMTPEETLNFGVDMALTILAILVLAWVVVQVGRWLAWYLR